MAGTEPGIVDIAHNQGTPVFRIGRPTPDMVAQIPQVGNRPVLISACYSRLIPEDTLALFDNTSVNIHPSLLPDLRGPDPMFWTFQRGTRVSGVSLHRMTSGFDAGPVVASQATEWVENQTERELEERLASVAVRLLDTYLANPVPGVEQDHTRATWAPVPGIEDFTVGPDWTEQRTNDFIRGISGRGIPVRFR